MKNDKIKGYWLANSEEVTWKIRVSLIRVVYTDIFDPNSPSLVIRMCSFLLVGDLSTIFKEER